MKGAKIRNRYNQEPHLTQDTNGKVTSAQLDTTDESQEGSPFPAGEHNSKFPDFFLTLKYFHFSLTKGTLFDKDLRFRYRPSDKSV